MSSYDKENLVPALLLVLGAGASTGIGAAVVFFPFLVKLANRRVLAASLGFSAGVMTYVSFIEIFGKSNESFVNAGHEEGRAYVYATLCFFGGALIMLVRIRKQLTLTNLYFALAFVSSSRFIFPLTDFKNSFRTRTT